MHDFRIQKSIITQQIWSRIQKDFAPESGAQGVLSDEKTESQKSHDTVL
jgi:hypothetical protein